MPRPTHLLVSQCVLYAGRAGAQSVRGARYNVRMSSSSSLSTKAMPADGSIVVRALASRNPEPAEAKAHHIDAVPSGFKNPWSSAGGHASITEVIRLKFGGHPEKNFIPVPQGENGTRSKELVQVRTPTWGAQKKNALRATWLGHASFLVETPIAGPDNTRGIRILFDPVFAERTSPLSWIGPKRYTPIPCSVGDLPDIDIVCISHNHYDHLDFHAIRELYQKRKGQLQFLVGLNNKAWFLKNIRCSSAEVTELDWWESVQIDVRGIGEAQFTCCPAQHTSRRTLFDAEKALWCSWVLETDTKKLYFAGDTAYQAHDTPSPCPIFQQIGKVFGGFDLSMLPIGLYSPPVLLGAVHATPEQSFEIHKAVKSKLSVGMHYGTVRGGLSAAFEDVRDPPRRWRKVAQSAGAWRGGGVEGDGSAVDSIEEGVGLCHVGETIAV